MDQILISDRNHTFRQTEIEANCLFSNRQSDYSYFLIEQDIKFTIADPYLLAGARVETDEWLIHITVVRQQFEQLIRPLLPFLKHLGVSFYIPFNAERHSSILDGRINFALTGKVITICAATLEEAKFIVQHLSDLTKSIIGPVMPCAYHLTDTIALSYRSFSVQNDSHTAKNSIFYGSTIADELKQILSSNDLKWTFQDIKPLTSFEQPRLLNKQYIPIETFKKDPKGNVFKALKINWIFDMQWCVIKQGRQYQSFDNSGRDANDRLAWQFGIHKHFEAKNILPKAIAYFELNGDAFFAMEYKESVSLTEKAVQLSEGYTWRSMPAERKREILQYLIQITDILSQFHEEGFVHRDVTPANFVVSDKSEVSAIDIELCYNVRTQTPNPPFTWGTPGYMSPAQANGSSPSFQDDIYSFGALLISIFTGVLPNKLNAKDSKRLEATLSYFIDSPSLVDVIISCLEADPAIRPALTEIKAVLELSDTILLTTRESEPAQSLPTTDRNSENILNAAVQTFACLVFANERDIPAAFSPGSERINTITNSYSATFTKPGSAVIAVLATAISHIPVNLKPKIILQLQNWLNNVQSIELPEPELQIFAAVLSQIKPGPDLQLSFMTKAIPFPEFTGGEPALGISDGMAGRGLKLLYLSEQQSSGFDPKQLTEIVSRITALQQKDGSWISPSQAKTKKRYKVTGFSHGVAGITYFLLSYYSRYKSEEIKTRIEAALNWLLKQRRSDGGKLTWPVSAENQTVDPWLEHGFSGVVLTFIKAYEVLDEPLYKEVATEVLRFHPFYITSNYCAFGNGLSGLGEIYLEAFRVFGEEEWLLRATSVRDILFNSCYRNDDVCYWLDGTQLDPTTDFWTGNAGVLHFLLRFKYPDEIHFPSHLIS